jgi:hypothetical protein
VLQLNAVSAQPRLVPTPSELGAPCEISMTTDRLEFTSSFFSTGSFSPFLLSVLVGFSWVSDLGSEDLCRIVFSIILDVLTEVDYSNLQHNVLRDD